MAEAGATAESLPTVAEKVPDMLQVTVGVLKDSAGHQQYKRFRVTGREYERVHHDLVPEGTPREEQDRILAEWVSKKFPYSQSFLQERKREFNQYKSFLELLLALKKGDIDGVTCMNTAAVLLGLLTRGKGQGEGYFYVGFTNPQTKEGHAVIYDNTLQKYVDPQIGVVSFDRLKNAYNWGNITEDAMEVLIPGAGGTKEIVLASTGEHLAP